MTLCSVTSGVLFLLGIIAVTQPVIAEVSTSTSLLVVLAPSTGEVNTSFAELSVVVFTNGTGTASELSSSGTVRVVDQGKQLGTSKLLPVNGSSLPGACAGFLLATLSAGDHNLTATFEGTGDFASSSSTPFIVTAGQAVPSKHDVGVPAPFQQGQTSESSLGVSIQPPTGFNTAQTGVEQYANIAQDSSFQQGTASWMMEGDAMVSASSSGSSNAPVKLGRGSYIWQVLWNQVVPLTAYVIEVQSAIDSGSGLAGALFFSGFAQKLSAQGIRLSSTGGGVQRGTLVAPPGSYFAALWVGNWIGGTLQVSSLRFGPLTSGPLPLDCSVMWRELPQGGVGINTNYLMDISPQWRSAGGPTFQESMKAMGIASLRYPGGEEANSYEWAPPPYTAQTRPQPVLTTGSGFPGGDWLFYDRFRGNFQSSVMNFDQLMDLCAALNISDPYLVLNHDSVNTGGPRASTEWGYVQLKQAAIAWAQYIVQKNYTARHFELSNESWKTNNAAQYAWALLDWAPAIKAVHPRALLGANGPAGRSEIGDKDTGVAWWPQVLGAASSVIDFVATHPYPVYGWDYLDYVSGKAPNLQQGVIEADLAISIFAAPKDRERIRIAVTETGVIDWSDKWQNGQADLGHAIVAFDVMANTLSHARVDVTHFWTTRWRFGGFSPSNNEGSVADALWDDNSLTSIGKALAMVGKYFKAGTLMSMGSSQAVRAWAVKQVGGSWVLLLLNKSFIGIRQTVSMSTCSITSNVNTIWQFTGSNYTDLHPTLVRVSSTLATLVNGSLSIVLPPVSITAIEF